MKTKHKHPRMKFSPRGSYTKEQLQEAWAIFTDMAGGADWRTVLTPESVLDAVLADESHPFRQYLEANVKKAARQYWISQIGRLMNEVRVSVTVTREPGRTIRVETRALVFTRSKTHGASRRPLTEIRKTKEERVALARIRAQYLRSWVGATEAQLAAISHPHSEENSALADLLSDVKRALIRFDASLRVTDAAE